MLISKRKARRMTDEAIRAVSARHAETVGNLNETIRELRKDRDDLFRANIDIKRELDAARKSLDSLMVGIKAEPSCDGCVRAGRYHSKCASCLRNPHAVDKWEADTNA